MNISSGVTFSWGSSNTTVCNLRPSIKVRAVTHVQLKIHDIAADAGAYQSKTEEMQKHICRQDV